MDRVNDVVESGDEWISSVEPENALMRLEVVVQAAVVDVPDERWGERPRALVALRPGTQVSGEEVPDHMRDRLTAFWWPDEVPNAGACTLAERVLRDLVQAGWGFGSEVRQAPVQPRTGSSV